MDTLIICITIIIILYFIYKSWESYQENYIKIASQMKKMSETIQSKDCKIYELQARLYCSITEFNKIYSNVQLESDEDPNSCEAFKIIEVEE